MDSTVLVFPEGPSQSVSQSVRYPHKHTSRTDPGLTRPLHDSCLAFLTGPWWPLQEVDVGAATSTYGGHSLQLRVVEGGPEMLLEGLRDCGRQLQG